MKKVIFIAILSLFLVGIFDVAVKNIAFARPVTIPAQCRRIARDLISYVNEPRGRMIAFQFASNKSRDGNGHFSITDGYLTNFQPRISPDVARFFPTRGRGIWQPVPFDVMDNFNDNTSNFRSGRSN